MYSLHEQYTVYYYSNGVSNMLFGEYVNHLYMTIYTCLTGILLFITQNTPRVVLYLYIFSIQQRYAVWVQYSVERFKRFLSCLQFNQRLTFLGEN